MRAKYLCVAAVVVGCKFDPAGSSGSDAQLVPHDTVTEPQDSLIHTDAPVDAPPDAPIDAAPDAPPPPIAFVQVANVFGGKQTETLKFKQPQVAHDLVVVMVGWINQTTPNTVASVTDAANDTFTLAIGPHSQGGMDQSIYYSCDVAAAGSNAVTVTFGNNSNVQSDVRIAEYSGLAATGCLDQAVFAVGNTPTIDSGPLTTTHARELLLATDCAFGNTIGSDATYTERAHTDFQDIIEDRTVTAVSTYHATMREDTTNDWVMMLLSFH